MDAPATTSPREPLRRRLRGRLLEGLSGLAGGLPQPLLRGGLEWAVRAAPLARVEELVRANLELALGEETPPARREQIARGVRRHAARQLAEWLRLASARRSPREAQRAAAWLERTVQCDSSVAILDEAARDGALAITAHIGNWELGVIALRRRGHHGAVIGRTRRDPSSAWLVELRRAWDVETLPQDAPPRRMLEVVRGGGTLGLLGDLEVPRLHGVWVPFFGRPALTMTAPAALARAARRPLVPIRCVARGQTYRVLAEEPLELDRGLDPREAVRELTARMNALFERWIRADPEQWAWHQPRWRTAEGSRRMRPLHAPLEAP